MILISVLNWLLLASFNIRVYYTLIPLLLSLQLFLSGLLEHLLVSKAGGSRWFALLVLPGTIVHELSHAVAALAAGCRITSISLFTFNRSGVLGSVTYVSKSGRLSFIRDVIISLSPFFGSSIAMMAVSRHLLDRVVSMDYSSITLAAVSGRVAGLVGFLASGYRLDSLSPWMVFALYLQVCFAFGAAPSSFDFDGLWASMRKNLTGLLLFLFLLAFTALLVESPPSLGYYGGVLSGIVTGLLDWAVFLLCFSIAMLLFSLILVYSASLWLASDITLKIISVVVFFILYYLSPTFLQGNLSLPLAWASGLAVMLLSKHARLFIKPGRSR